MLKLTIATLAATLNAAPETAANETCGPRLPMKRLQYSCPVSKTIDSSLSDFEPAIGVPVERATAAWPV